MGLLLAIVAVSIAVSFLCSILEAVLLSVTPSYIAQRREQQPRLHAQLKNLKTRIDQPLAAILTLNTIAHTFGAAGVGAQVGVVFGDGFLVIASAIMTVMILVLSEIIPKTLGAMHWQRIAPFLPVILKALILIMKPAIWCSDRMTRWMGYSAPAENLRNEIKSLTRYGRDTGELDEDEKRVICNILDLHEVRLQEIMTPRTVCDFVQPDQTVSQVLEKMDSAPFSRFPVLGTDEHPHGVVFRNEILSADPQQTMADIMRPVLVLVNALPAETALSKLLAEHQHMCLVYDEYGTWMGLVTLEDILETILGQAIIDETDDIPNMRRYARKRWESRMREANRSGNQNL